jgi:hypothetical protein
LFFGYSSFFFGEFLNSRAVAIIGGLAELRSTIHHHKIYQTLLGFVYELYKIEGTQDLPTSLFDLLLCYFSKNYAIGANGIPISKNYTNLPAQ